MHLLHMRYSYESDLRFFTTILMKDANSFLSFEIWIYYIYHIHAGYFQ